MRDHQCERCPIAVTSVAAIGRPVSEDHFPCELKRTRGIEGTRSRHGTKIARRDRIARIESLLNLRVGIAGAGMVKQIPSLRAELELQVIPDIEALE